MIDLRVSSIGIADLTGSMKIITDIQRTDLEEIRSWPVPLLLTSILHLCEQRVQHRLADIYADAVEAQRTMFIRTAMQNTIFTGIKEAQKLTRVTAPLE